MLFSKSFFSLNGSLVDKHKFQLNSNATAISLDYTAHVNNRTWGDRNTESAKKDGLNSQALRIATLKDFATILMAKRNNLQNYSYRLLKTRQTISTI